MGSCCSAGATGSPAGATLKQMLQWRGQSGHQPPRPWCRCCSGRATGPVTGQQQHKQVHGELLQLRGRKTAGWGYLLTSTTLPQSSAQRGRQPPCRSQGIPAGLHGQAPTEPVPGKLLTCLSDKRSIRSLKKARTLANRCCRLDTPAPAAHSASTSWQLLGKLIQP